MIHFHLMPPKKFKPLETEFWHYYFKRERNYHTYYDFDIKDCIF